MCTKSSVAGIDVNSEYSPPNSDDSSSYHRLSSVLFPSAVSTGPLPHPSPYLLLHIAVVNKDLDMVLYLLDKGAEVRPFPYVLEVSFILLCR